MEMLSDEPLNGDKPSTDQMAVEKVDTTVKENFYIIIYFFVLMKSFIKISLSLNVNLGQ